MKEIIKNNVIYGFGVMVLLYLLMWLEPDVFANVPVITPLLITSVFVCCTCSFDFVHQVWKSVETKGEKQEMKRLCEMVNCLIERRATGLRIYKAEFDDKTFIDRIDFV